MQRIQKRSICDLINDIKTDKNEHLTQLKEACAQGGDKALDLFLSASKLGTINTMKKKSILWEKSEIIIKQETPKPAPEPAKKDPVQNDPKPQKQPVIR